MPNVKDILKLSTAHSASSFNQLFSYLFNTLDLQRKLVMFGTINVSKNAATCVATALTIGFSFKMLLAAPLPGPSPFFVWSNSQAQFVASGNAGNPEVGYFEFVQSDTPANNSSIATYQANYVDIDAHYDAQSGIAIGLAGTQQTELHFMYSYDPDTQAYSTVPGVPALVTGNSGTVLDKVFFQYSHVPGLDGQHELAIYFWTEYSVGHLFLIPGGGIESTVQGGYWDYAAFTLRIDLYKFINWWYI